MTYLCTSLFKNTGQKIEARASVHTLKRATICCAALIDAGGTSFPWSSAAVNRQEPGVGRLTMYLREVEFFLHAAEAHCLPVDACHHPLSPLAQNLPGTVNRNFQRMRWQEENLFQSDGFTLNLGEKLSSEASDWVQILQKETEAASLTKASAWLILDLSRLPTLYTKSSHLIKGRFWRLGELSVEKPHRWKCREEWIALV